jgi:hypothetical protein
VTDSRQQLSSVLEVLRELETDVPDPERIDEIRLLEEIKSAAAAAQARVTAQFSVSQRAAQTAAGVPAAQVGRGIAAQVGLARRCSPAAAQRYVGWAMILTEELPATLTALQAGRISEWRAMLIARETAWLARAHRLAVDRELAPQLDRFGDRAIEAAAKRIGYRLDPHGYVERFRAAETDRRVWIRPAPDAMVRLSALLPVATGVSAYATLCRDADTCLSGGDERGRGQLMADLLVQRVTGQAHAGDVPVEINLVMTDQALLGAGPGRDEPADIPGYGPVPAPIARHLATRTGTGGVVPRWIRRLYVAPSDGQLVALESRRRLFTPAQRRFLRLRDQSCRTPWCDAPIRHTDHVLAHVAGGRTTISNGQGLCVACNHAKQAPGWSAQVTDPGGTITTRTPTGHTYRSRAPDLPAVGTPCHRHREFTVDWLFAPAA